MRASRKESEPAEGESRAGSRVLDRFLDAVLAHENVLVFGGTSTGKTSLLNAALAAAAAERPDERVLILEDTFELQPSHRDVVAMRTEERLGVGLHELVKASLRMEPDRIVVGEVRGGEALDLVDAWSTGHAGGLASLHATSARGALERLEHLAGRHPESSQGASLRWYVGSAVGVVVGMRRGEAGPFVSEIHRVGIDGAGNYQLSEL
jgi:type IV secretion system protein VirB11